MFPEGILLGTACILMLLLTVGIKKNSSIFVVLSILGTFGAAVASIVVGKGVENGALVFGALQVDSSFVLARCVLFLVSAILILFMNQAEEVNEKYKGEFCFFIVCLAFFASILLLSRHFLVSYISLAALGLISLLLSALSLGKESEAEASVKWWYQLAFCFTLGFGALVYLSVDTRELTFLAIRNYVVAHHSGGLFALMFLVLLPFWSIAGIFPFQFVGIDVNHGSSWSVHATQTLLVQSVSVLAFLKWSF